MRLAPRTTSPATVHLTMRRHDVDLETEDELPSVTTSAPDRATATSRPDAQRGRAILLDGRVHRVAALLVVAARRFGHDFTHFMLL